MLDLKGGGNTLQKRVLPAANDSFSRSDSLLFLSRLTTLRLLAALWSIAAFLDLMTSFSGGGTAFTVVRISFTYCCGFVFSYIVYHSLNKVPISVTDLSFVRTLLIAIPSGSALFMIDVFGRAFAHGDSPLKTWPIDYILRLRPMWSYFTMLFVFQSAITWLTASARALAVRERQLLDSRLAALRLQLNPHFLFNTLNAILTLVSEAGAVEAEEMIMRLSNFLQLSLIGEPKVLVPLADEIDMVQAYLSIEEVRFGNRLKVNYSCEVGLADVQVPNFILQPLVENAVKHAVALSEDPVTILVEAKCDGEFVSLKVEDDARVQSTSAGAPGNGVGIRNITTRLEVLYGSNGRIETFQRDVGFAAVLRLPLTRLVSSQRKSLSS